MSLRPTLLRLLAVTLFITSAPTRAADVERTGGPYVPTPQVVVDAMLDLAQVEARDFVVDLGSGDGRIVLTAAERFSARGLGVDIDPELVQLSNEEAKKRGFGERVSFRLEDVLKTRIDQATVVTLYLLPGMMQQLQAKFTKELKPGTRIVSHDFPFGEWKPDREVVVDVPEKYGSPGQWKSTLFYWVVPAQVHGQWQLTSPALAAALPLTLEQQFQFVQGGAMNKGKRVPITGGKVDADRIGFKLALADGVYDFAGVIQGDRMRGEAVSGGRTVEWTALRYGPAAAVAR